MSLPKLHYKLKITYELELLTGLHIGAGKDTAEIGGIDLPVVRRKDNYQPYIPGSSLKGKLRTLLCYQNGEKDASGRRSSIRDLFGNTDKDNGNASRLIVRDAYLTPESARALKDSPFTDMPYTEVKFENTINKLKGSAEHPRQIERVPAGAKFLVEFIINIMDHPKQSPERSSDKLKEEYLKLLQQGISLLENDYLGGHGSRGYGQVKFSKKQVETL